MMMLWFAEQYQKFLRCSDIMSIWPRMVDGVVDLVDDSFDVVILDINMPDMDGFETMDELNKLKYDIPVLFLTGAGSMDYAVKAINIGAYDFLTKPIEDLDIFNVKIRRAIEKRTYVLQGTTVQSSP